MLSVPLRFSALEAVPRRGEPVTVGLPWPRGAISDDQCFALIGPDGTPQVLQTQVLDRWPDGSIRWCLFDFLATWDGTSSESGFTVAVNHLPRPATPIIAPTATPPTMGLVFRDHQDRQSDAPLEMAQSPSEAGPLRVRDAITTMRLGGLIIHGQYELHVPCGAIRFQLTLQNAQPAGHPGGNWDLGNAGSVYLKAFSVIALYDTNEPASILLSCERGQPLQAREYCIIQQTASGGKNWKSANHVDRNHHIPLMINGYQHVTRTDLRGGDRATPVVVLDGSQCHLALTIPAYWENFPISLAAHPDRLQLDLMPYQEHHLHELQGGEQKTYSFTLAFANRKITDDPLVWARSPITVTAPPEWYASTGAMPYLTPKANDPHTTYLNLVDQAIDGPDTFIHKREKIDEYGWRHFGDIYGDHEAVFHTGLEPMVSHYNNQYDCVLGFMTQYLRSGDVRWLRQGLECADHTCDIDIYHTTRDKSAYNGGLFWHTYHYAPADTGTHRSYPKSLRTATHFDDGQDLQKMGQTGAKLKQNYAVGGGPSAAHNYNAGLMLAYFLTGKPMYKETAIGLADFVLNMDDGSKTVFKWLCRRDTGLAIESSAGYLGPGRASANSLLAVLVGYRLTGDETYWGKAAQIVRRVVHPTQNLESLDLLNAELRWFYTMFLQALGTYLDYKIELNQLDDDYNYARLSLLHYARYMALHERPILDQPEELQYPTETWAAQDMRKVEVFQFAAKHASGDERTLFLNKAEWFFEYVVRTLDGFETKSFCRPVILMMNFGWSRAWWKQNADASAPKPLVGKPAGEYGTWTMMKTQKQIAMKRAKAIAVATAFAMLVGFVLLMVTWFRG